MTGLGGGARSGAGCGGLTGVSDGVSGGEFGGLGALIRFSLGRDTTPGS